MEVEAKRARRGSGSRAEFLPTTPPHQHPEAVLSFRHDRAIERGMLLVCCLWLMMALGYLH